MHIGKAPEPLYPFEDLNKMIDDFMQRYNDGSLIAEFEDPNKQEERAKAQKRLREAVARREALPFRGLTPERAAAFFTLPVKLRYPFFVSLLVKFFWLKRLFRREKGN